MDVRSLAYRTDLALLALAGAEIEDRGTHLVVRSPGNPAFHWGNFHLLQRPPTADQVEATIAAFDADFPDAEHRSLGVDGVLNQGAAVAAFTPAGFEVETSTVMTATSVHPPPRPHLGAELRPLVSDDDWAQRVEVSAAVNTDHEREAYLAFATRKAAHDREVCESGHGAWWGAFRDGRLASVMGLVDAGGGLARYQSVETHPDLRGRGLAGTLVHRVAAYGFDELGAQTLVMVADPDYVAIRVYRSVGFEGTETQTALAQPHRPR